MPRRGGLDWEAANRRQRQRQAEPDKPVQPRRSERSDQWLLRSMRYAARCEQCSEEVVKGERALMLRDDGRWRFRHEMCRE